MIPISKEGTALRVAIADPSNNFAIDDIKFLTGMKVAVHVAAESAITDAIDRFYPKPDTGKQGSAGPGGKADKEILEVDDLNKMIGSALDEMPIVEEKEDKDLYPKEVDAPVVKLVNGILMNAINQGASDIHIEPADQMVRVRYRIDGVLQAVLTNCRSKSRMQSRLASRSSRISTFQSAGCRRTAASNSNLQTAGKSISACQPFRVFLAKKSFSAFSTKEISSLT